MEERTLKWLPLIRGWERKWERVRLAGASLGSLVLASACADLRRRGVKWGGGVVVAILTSEGSLVRTQLRPRPGQKAAREQPEANRSLITGQPQRS